MTHRIEKRGGGSDDAQPEGCCLEVEFEQFPVLGKGMLLSNSILKRLHPPKSRPKLLSRTRVLLLEHSR